jgi:hypothetical protein
MDGLGEFRSTYLDHAIASLDIDPFPTTQAFPKNYVRYLRYIPNEEFRKDYHVKFFRMLKIGDAVVYSDAYMIKEVIKLAREHGVTLRYANREERMRYSSLTAIVVDKDGMFASKATEHKFDVNELEVEW